MYICYNNFNVKNKIKIYIKILKFQKYFLWNSFQTFKSKCKCFYLKIMAKELKKN